MRRYARVGSWLLLVVGCLLPVVACSSSDEAAPLPCEGIAHDAQEKCLTDHYFQGYGPQPVPPCAGFTKTAERVAGRKEIDFFMGIGAVDAHACTEGQFLQRFYETYDLTFFTRRPAAPAAVTYAR